MPEDGTILLTRFGRPCNRVPVLPTSDFRNDHWAVCNCNFYTLCSCGNSEFYTLSYTAAGQKKALYWQTWKKKIAGIHTIQQTLTLSNVFYCKSYSLFSDTLNTKYKFRWYKFLSFWSLLAWSSELNNVIDHEDVPLIPFAMVINMCMGVGVFCMSKYPLLSWQQNIIYWFTNILF